MAIKGVNLLLHDLTDIDTPKNGRVLVSGDDTTGLPAALLPSGIKVPWGNSVPVAPEVKTDDFIVTGADHESVFDCQGAVNVTLPIGVAAGTIIRLIHTRNGDVTAIDNDGISVLISEYNNIAPLYFQDQGKVITCYNLGNDQWYVVGDALNSGDLPLTIDGCALWTDFSDYLNTTDAVNNFDPITIINDKSEEGNNTSQVNATNQARIEFSQLNGLAAARFDGNDYYVLPPGFNNICLVNNTLFVVAWQPSDQNNQWPIGGDSVGDDWGIKTISGRFEFHNGGFVRDNVSSRDLTVPSITVGRREGNFMLIFNGLTQTGTGNNGSSPLMSNCVIGGRGGLSKNWNGWISEIISYRRALSTSEREAVTRYLIGKYGL